MNRWLILGLAMALPACGTLEEIRDDVGAIRDQLNEVEDRLVEIRDRPVGGSVAGAAVIEFSFENTRHRAGMPHGVPLPGTIHLVFSGTNGDAQDTLYEHLACTDVEYYNPIANPPAPNTHQRAFCSDAAASQLCRYLIGPGSQAAYFAFYHRVARISVGEIETYFARIGCTVAEVE